MHAIPGDNHFASRWSWDVNFMRDIEHTFFWESSKALTLSHVPSHGSTGLQEPLSHHFPQHRLWPLPGLTLRDGS